MRPRPLDHITVVSIEQALAAPYATRHLADLGARVIKVERRHEGDFARHYDSTVRGESSYFVWLNRSKESITLDFKRPEGREVLDALLSIADVFVQNVGPGAAARVGLDYATLSNRFPKLIVCDISGYGVDGPWAGRKAYDMVVQFETGLVSLTGTQATPSRVGISVADIAAAMYAYSGILSALYRRETTGESSNVRVALFDALAEWMGQPAYYTQYGGRQPNRVGAEHATIAPYGPVETADGLTVVMAIQNNREWVEFCEVVLEDPAVAHDPRFHDNASRVANRAEVNDVVSRRFAVLTASEATDLLDRARIANGRLRSVRDLLTHPALTTRERWRVVDSPGGSIDALIPPADLSGVEPRMDPIPRLGAHTEAVLAELGFDSSHVERLRSQEVI